ncbi:hypothetical protein ACU610_21570 [Geodermatophilus sp. URMC 61]|uniref:hypothetical protein n=1 Tax=Geodermatophilus sp. URMC 61 TaxID=3423411 RepID=UPI00406BFA7B
MAFAPDQAAEYRKRVLTAFRKQRLPELQAGLRELKTDPGARVPASLDVVDLYDLSSVGSDAEVAAHVAGVLDVFNKTLTNQSFKKIGPTLVEIHQLLAERNPDLCTAAFWRARLADRQADGGRRLDEFVHAVVGEAGILKVVTTERLTGLAQEVGVAAHADAAEIAAAVRAAGVDVVTPVAPPATPVPAAVLTELGSTSLPSIVDAIFLQRPPVGFRVVDGFAGDDGERLARDTVRASRRITEQRSVNDNENAAIKRVLGILADLPDDRTLEQVVLAWFVEAGRQAVQSEPALTLALKRLTATRLDRLDAARILTLFAGGESRTGGFPGVRQKIEAGALKEARRLFEATASVSGNSDAGARTEAQQALEAGERRVAELRARAQAAVESGDLATARQALDEALSLSADDPALAEMLAALPPAPPLNLAAATGPDGRTVRLSWEPGFGTTDDVTYVVVCRTGAAPRNAQDGTVLAEGVTATRFDHPTPDLATPLHYGVAARRSGAPSPVVSLPVTVLPPVRDVRVDADPDSVTLTVSPPSGARAVHVLQVGPDGRQTELHPDRHGAVVSTGLTTGATYTYLLTALYATATGDLAAEPCRVTGVPREPVRPVPSVAVRLHTEDGGTPELEAGWQAVPGYDVEIWHTAGPPRWAYGARVPMAEIAAVATRLAGVTAGSGSRDGVRGPAAAGLRHYVAVTRDGDVGVIGQSNEVGVCPTPTGVTAERFHGVVVLGWDWPGEEFDVLATWDGQVPGERLITRARYVGEGGLRIVVGTQTSRVRLRTVPASGGRAWSSPEAVVTVPGAAPGVRYTTSWHKRIARPAHAVTLTFGSEERPEAVPIVVVGQPGQVMPYTPDSGVVLAEQTLDLSATGSAELTVPLRGLGRSFWVRAFARDAAGVRLIDPPSTDLRGA